MLTPIWVCACRAKKIRCRGAGGMVCGCWSPVSKVTSWSLFSKMTDGLGADVLILQMLTLICNNDIQKGFCGAWGSQYMTWKRWRETVIPQQNEAIPLGAKITAPDDCRGSVLWYIGTVGNQNNCHGLEQKLHKVKMNVWCSSYLHEA